MIHQVRMYCGLSVKINMHETPHGMQRLWTHFVCVCFYVCGEQKPEYPPNLSPMADDAINWGSIQGLGSPLYICALDTLHVLQLGVTRLFDHIPLHTVCASLRITARPGGGGGAFILLIESCKLAVTRLFDHIPLHTVCASLRITARPGGGGGHLYFLLSLVN